MIALSLPVDYWDYLGWKDTLATLHMWTQVVGKIRLAKAPMVNHWWQVALYVSLFSLGHSITLLAGVFGLEAHQLVAGTDYPMAKAERLKVEEGSVLLGQSPPGE